jgi:adenine-specific DNA-methyltransferase
LFGYRAFNYPKPLSLIRELVRQSTAPGDITLDFFAGSGTTAHAVMALNAEDGGDRRFIMVSNTEATADAPDKNLCRDVLRERVRRAADKLGLEPRVAYLRAARVKMADLDWEDGLTDQRAWTLLRMMHGLPVAPLDMADGVAAATLPEGGAIAYLDQLSEAGAARLAALATDGPVIAYAWAPGQVRVRFEDDPRVEPRPVVDSLLARFRP